MLQLLCGQTIPIDELKSVFQGQCYYTHIFPLQKRYSNEKNTLRLFLKHLPLNPRDLDHANLLFQTLPSMFYEYNIQDSHDKYRK